MFRNHPDYNQQLLTGLTQLASLQGDIFADKSSVAYASKILRGLLPFMRAPSGVEEIVGISQVLFSFSFY